MYSAAELGVVGMRLLFLGVLRLSDVSYSLSRVSDFNGEWQDGRTVRLPDEAELIDEARTQIVHLGLAAS